MAQIDNIIAFMTKLGGHRLEVPSARSCLMTTASGQRPLNRVLTLEEVQGMVEEILPKDCKERYAAGGTFSFAHQANGLDVVVQVTKAQGDLTAVIALSEEALKEEPEPEPEKPEPAERADEKPAAKAAAEPERPAPSPSPSPSQASPARGESVTAAPVAVAGPTPVYQPVPAAPSGPLQVTGAAPEQLVAVAEAAGAYQAQDVLLLPDRQPQGRYTDGLRPLEQFDFVSAAQISDWVNALCPAAEAAAPAVFTAALGERYRGRFSVARTRETLSVSLRLLRQPPPALEDLGAPAVLGEACREPGRLVLVMGRSGMGRSTLSAALVADLNSKATRFVITLSPTLEYLHPLGSSVVSERAVGDSPEAWVRHLRTVGVEHPDVVTVENVGSSELLLAAIELAQSGPTVVAEVPAVSSVAGLEGLLRQLRQGAPEKVEALAEVFGGSVYQVLCTTRHDSVCAAHEVLLPSPALVASLAEGNTTDLLAHVRSGRSQGMCALTESLHRLVSAGTLEGDEAVNAAIDKEEMRDTLAADGPPEQGKAS